MSKKVKLAIFDRDLKVRKMGTFEVSKDGSKIKVKGGGKGNFNPSFDNESYLEFPRRFRGFERIYIVRKGAKACVNFKDNPATVYGPDPEQVIEAAENKILTGIGKDKQDIHWSVYAQLFLIILILIKVLGVM